MDGSPIVPFRRHRRRRAVQDVGRIFVAVVRRPEEEQGTRRRTIVKNVFQGRGAVLEIAFVGVYALVLLDFDALVEGGVVGA